MLPVPSRTLVIGLLIIALLGGAVFGATRYGGMIWHGISDFYLEHEPQFILDIKNETLRKEAAQCIEEANPEIWVGELGIIKDDVYVSFLFRTGQASSTHKLLHTISTCVLEHIPNVQKMNLARLIVVVDEQDQVLGPGLVIYMIVARVGLEGLRDSKDAEEYFLLGSMNGTIFAECPACSQGVPPPWEPVPKFNYHLDEASSAASS